MTNEELVILRELVNKATTGPWKVETGYSGNNWLVAIGGSVDGNSYTVTTDHVHASELEGDARTDAEFIAACRTAVPELLDALDAATQRAQAAEAATIEWRERALAGLQHINKLERTAAEYVQQMAAADKSTAERIAEMDALALELAHLRPEWEQMRQERDAARAKLGDWQAKCSDLEADLLGWRRMVRNTSEERDLLRASATALEAERDAARAQLAAATQTDDWHILRPIEPETPDSVRVLADTIARNSELEAQLAAVPVEALRYLYRSDYEYRNNTNLHYYVQCQKLVRAWLDA